MFMKLKVEYQNLGSSIDQQKITSKTIKSFDDFIENLKNVYICYRKFLDTEILKIFLMRMDNSNNYPIPVLYYHNLEESLRYNMVSEYQIRFILKTIESLDDTFKNFKRLHHYYREFSNKFICTKIIENISYI